MKTYKTLMAGLTGMALLVGAAQAQYQATGNDGITASPKAREAIDKRAGTSARTAAPMNHACATCKDEFVTRVDASAKGAVKPTVLVAKHLCAGCETAVTTQGQSKASREVITHKCSSGGTACCAAKKT